MKIAFEYPPNIEQIKKVLHPSPTMVFTYGDTIYNPARGHISAYLATHEETHMLQQKNPKEWWSKYLSDVSFRLDQELEAYKNQYHLYCRDNINKVSQHKFLHEICDDLSSASYGNCISYPEAWEKISGLKPPFMGLNRESRRKLDKVMRREQKHAKV